jgi:hypothetical protein
MLWDEIDLEKNAAHEAIRRAAAAAFSVAAADVVVVADLARTPGVKAPVLVEARATQGDFRLRLGFYLKEQRGLDRKAVRASMARALSSRLLADDGDTNPYTRELIEPDGSSRKVRLDPEALDEREQLVLADRPHEESARERYSALINAYRDRPPDRFPATEAASRAFGVLERTIARVPSVGAPSAEVVNALKAAIADVRKTFPREQIAPDTSTGRLVQAAEIAVSGELE